MNIRFFTIILPLIFLASCNGNDNNVSERALTPAFEKMLSNSSADIIYEDGWMIVSKIEDGNHIYWFLPPEKDNVSPALFKKIIFLNDET